MADDKKDDELIKEAYERAYNYDPDEEELKKKYSEEFIKKWLD